MPGSKYTHHIYTTAYEVPVSVIKWRRNTTWEVGGPPYMKA